MPDSVKILFCSPRGKPSPLDWSGIPHHLAQALERLTRVDYLALPERYADILPKWHPSHLWRRALSKWPPIHTSRVARRIGRLLAEARPGADTVCFATSSSPFAFAPPSVRVAFFTDTVMDSYFRLYGIDRHLSAWDIRRERALEQRSLERADAIFFASRWARDECQRRLPATRHARTFVVLMGANLPAPVVPLQPRRAQPRLLWVGVEWERKGGSLALELFRRLRSVHGGAEITLVGAGPGSAALPSGCTQVSFLDKSRREDCEKLARLYATHDFLVHPTLADCSACVASEAQLHGCVPLTSTVGGVPELLVQNRTGYAFDILTYVAEAAMTIERLVSHPGEFGAMREAACEHALRNLTWDVIARRILDSLAKMNLRRGDSPP